MPLAELRAETLGQGDWFKLISNPRQRREGELPCELAIIICMN